MKTKRTLTTIFEAMVISLATILLAVLMLSPGQGGVAKAADGAKARGATAVRVEVTQAQRRPLKRILRMPATLLPGESADLYAKTSGYVSAVNVDIGSRVKKGEPLLTIDVPEMADELRQAQAVLAAKRAKVRALQAKVVQADAMIATARAEVQRFEAEHRLWQVTADRKRQLLQAEAIPEQAFDEANSRLAVAEAQMRIAQAAVASAEAQRQFVNADVSVARSEVAVEEAGIARLKTLMDYTTIRAPSDGVITNRLVHPGAFVRSAAEGASMPLLILNKIDFLRLALEIPGSDVPWVRIGTAVDIRIKALDGEPIEATVTRTAIALKANTRTMRAEVDLDNKDGRLAPGMYARVTVTLESKKQAMMIPSKAIRVRGKVLSVLVVDALSPASRGLEPGRTSGVAKAIPITIGYDDGIWAEVLSGLSGDEPIIVSTSGAVAPGAPVKATPVSSSST